MIYTVIPNNSDEPWFDVASWEEALAYCNDKEYVAGRDCTIACTDGDVE